MVSVASLPAAVAVFLRAHRRDPLPAALTGLVSIHVYIVWGFINYSLGLVFALLALAALAALVRAPSWRRAIAFGVAAAACFYSHALAYAWLGLASAVQIAAMAPMAGMSRTRQALLRAAVAAGPSMVGMAFWMTSSRVLERGEIGGQGLAETGAPGGGRPVFASLQELLGNAYTNAFGFYRDGAEARIIVAFIAVALLLVGLRARWRARDRGARTRWETTYAPELVAASALASYLFAPVAYNVMQPIGQRYLPLALALVPAFGPARMTPAARRMVAAVLAVALIGMADVHSRRFSLAERELGELPTALGHTQPGKRLLGLVFARDSAIFVQPIHLHEAQYYQVLVGGLAAWSFVDFLHSPLGYRGGHGPPPFPLGFEWNPASFDWERRGGYFDYFLVRTERDADAPPLFPAGAVSVLFEGPRWKLYARQSESVRPTGSTSP